MHRWGVQQFSAPAGELERAEADMKRKFTAMSVYDGMDGKGYILPKQVTDAMAVAPKNGIQIFRNINAIYYDNKNRLPIEYQAILDGAWDSQIQLWAEWVTQCRIPRGQLTLTWQHEPTIGNAAQPKKGDWGGPQYAKTFRYFFDKMVGYGATRDMYRIGFYPVAANYVPHKAGHGVTEPPKADSFWPGDDYVDVCGSDFYRYKGMPSTGIPAYLDAHGAYAAAHGGKRIGFGEVGSTMTDGTRPDWITWFAGAILALDDVIHVNWNLKPEFGLLKQPERNSWLDACDGWM